jgi:uncharacterized membrane protein YkvA (DUF1232 family)
LYVISPIDLAPDFIPILGQLDDLVALGMTVRAVLKKAEKEGSESTPQK